MPKKGYKHTEEAKRKIGEKSLGRIPWNKGKTGEELERHYKDGFPKGMLGKKHTEEAKKGMSENHLGIIPWNRNLTAETDVRVAKGVESLLESYENRDCWKKGLNKENDERVAKSAEKLSVTMKLLWANMKKYNLRKYLAWCKAISAGLKEAFADPNFTHYKVLETIEQLRKEYDLPENMPFKPVSYYEHRFARSLRMGLSTTMTAPMSWRRQHPRLSPRHPGDNEYDPYKDTTFPVEEEQYGIVNGVLKKLKFVNGMWQIWTRL